MYKSLYFSVQSFQTTHSNNLSDAGLSRSLIDQVITSDDTLPSSTIGSSNPIDTFQTSSSSSPSPAPPPPSPRHLPNPKMPLRPGDIPSLGDGKFGFLWSWNHMLTKKWASPLLIDDTDFVQKVLMDFTAFCANEEGRLQKLLVVGRNECNGGN